MRMKIRIKKDKVITKYEIPDIATVYKLSEEGDRYVLIADYNNKNIGLLKNRFTHVFSYNGKYVIVFFNADAIYGVVFRIGTPSLDIAYMFCYRKNNNILDQASSYFKKRIIGFDNLTNEEEEYIRNHIKIPVYYQKICCITENGIRFIRVFSPDKSAISIIKVQRGSPTMAFCWQTDILGISDDDDRIYSEFCTKEEYDRQLYIALKNIGVNDFSI